ncbi:MAG: hemin uptake protein HemP [Planctomycetota bacterium]
MSDDPDKSDGEDETAEPSDLKPRQWSSKELLEGHSEAIIMHAGEVYRLRCTRNNRLILTK